MLLCHFGLTEGSNKNKNLDANGKKVAPRIISPVLLLKLKRKRHDIRKRKKKGLKLLKTMIKRILFIIEGNI